MRRNPHFPAGRHLYFAGVEGAKSAFRRSKRLRMGKDRGDLFLTQSYHVSTIIDSAFGPS